MLATWQLEIAFQIVLAATPVAVYFLILGLLNSQRQPQLLSARTDFTLLMAALSPLCVVPLLRWIGVTPAMIAASAAVVVAGIALAAPRRGGGWVIYNIGRNRATESITAACRAAGLGFKRRENGLDLDDGARLRISTFPLLRNVSITVEGAGESHRNALQRFENELTRSLGRLEVTANPTAVAFVLVSTAAIVAPLAMMADRMPEMVRLLTDLLG